MNLTVEQLLVQIVKFLETDQPNMAALYMKKALELLKKEKIRGELDRVLPFVTAVCQAIEGVWNALVEAAAPFIDAFTSLTQVFQSDFALAADHE